MSFGVRYDSLDNPTISIVGEELPAMWPPEAPWMLIGGGGGMFQAEYAGAIGMIFGSPNAGLTWGATIMSAGPADQEQVVADWTVAAGLFTAEGVAVRPLSVSYLDPKHWKIETPDFGTGPKRLMVISVTARKPGATSVLRTPGLLLVAAS
ncbi:MAG: hypothetical protein WCK73_15220 [Deltaproteobacteria bacterium]